MHDSNSPLLGVQLFGKVASNSDTTAPPYNLTKHERHAILTEECVFSLENELGTKLFTSRSQFNELVIS